MDDQTRIPAFNVHEATMGGLIPLARYYYCISCEHDLTDWVMKQSAGVSSICPNCQVHIDEKDIAQAQRDTRFGCLWTIVAIASLFLFMAAILGLVWLMTGRRPWIRL